MRALAHPVRLAILSFLRRNGPTTATVLAPHVGATPSVPSLHLRHLAGFGLVTDADPAEVPGDLIDKGLHRGRFVAQPLRARRRIGGLDRRPVRRAVLAAHHPGDHLHRPRQTLLFEQGVHDQQRIASD